MIARPEENNPTPNELAILKILWEMGPSTVRDVMQHLQTDRAYTSVMSLMNVMSEKGLLTRKPAGRAFIYRARYTPDKTRKQMLSDLLGRAFEGSAQSLVSHLLDESNPTDEELLEIRRTIDAYRKAKKTS